MSLLFTISFQSGEFYFDNSSWWIDLLINVAGALVGTFVALYLTIRRERRKEREKRTEDNNERMYFLSSMLENILKVSQKQVQYFKDFIDKFANNQLSIPYLEVVPHTDLKWFTESFHRDEYLIPFLENFGKTETTVDNYRKIFSLISGLNSQFDQVGGVIKEGLTYDWERKKQYKQISDDSLDRIAVESLKLKSIEPRTEFSVYLESKFMKAAVEHLQPGEFDIAKYQTEFVEPQKNELKKYYSDEFALYAIMELRKMSVLYNEMIRNNEALIDRIRQIANDYEIETIELDQRSAEMRYTFPIRSTLKKP